MGRQRTVVNFGEHLGRMLARLPAGSPPVGCRDPKGRVCTLCLGSRVSDYTLESKAKATALTSWGKQFRELPEIEFTPSPMPRHYRSVSKRRWKVETRQWLMVEGIERGRIQGIAPRECQVEPFLHAAIYKSLQEQSGRAKLGLYLNYAVIKSGRDGCVLVLNMKDTQAERAEVNRVSKALTRKHPELLGVWLVQGDPEDDYYMNVRPGHWQKLHGSEFLTSELGLRYSPLGFSQINPHAVPAMLEYTARWLGDTSLPLLDLFCGYGLFSLGLERTGPSWGAEISREAVHFARNNARYRKRARAKFEAYDLARNPIPQNRLPEGRWVAVLDPPRAGASAELIEQLATAGPQRVVHWICSMDQAQAQIEAWSDADYKITQCVAVDMFPGTDNIELGLCLEPRQEARRPKRKLPAQ